MLDFVTPLIIHFYFYPAELIHYYFVRRMLNKNYAVEFLTEKKTSQGYFRQLIRD